MKDIQVNFLKSAELRADYAAGPVIPVSVEGTAQRAKEGHAHAEFLRVSNIVASPKQEKPFTALPVIVS